MRQVLVPVHPGTFSAFGILTADARYDLGKMVMGLEVGSEDLERMLSELEAQGREQLEGERLEHARVDCLRTVELRYAGQDHPLAVELEDEGGDLVARAQLLFHEKHRRLYGFQRDDTPMELVRLQVSVIGRTPAVAQQGVGLRRPGWHHGTRAAGLAGSSTPVVAGSRRRSTTGATLSWGDAIGGPAVVEEGGSTTYVPEGWKLTVLEDLTLRLAAR